MSSRRSSRLGSAVLICSVMLAVVAITTPAFAWIENHVIGDDVRIELDRTGKAVVEHRLTLKTNGNVRLREYRIDGIASDAEPLPNSYVVPQSDALSSSLASAIPVAMELIPPKADGERGAALKLKVDDRKGLRRGSYVFVLRYRTDLIARGQIERDGALVKVSWAGPQYDDGFDNARTTFAVPAAPSPPRTSSEVASLPSDAEEATLPGTFFSEVRRGGEIDEIELLRTFAAKEESVEWVIRVDARSLDVGARERVAPPDTPVFSAMSADLASRDVQLGVASGLLLLLLVLAWRRGREVARLSAEAAAETPPLVPFPLWLRAPLAALAFVAGLGLQVLWFKPVAGALCVVGACILAGHGASRSLTSASRRGPGRWLTVTEREAFGTPAPRRGAWLDVSTSVGKLLLLLLLGGWSAGVYWFALRAPALAVVVGFDAVVLLAIFGTGRLTGLPPDRSTEPARFLQRLVRALRKKRGLEDARLVPRIRIPHGEVDPDELRLLIAPRMALRGFAAIEVGLNYALGYGTRVAMPEVLLRVVADSPCDRAVAAISRRARITPGRKPDERVIAFSPRLPTVRMTQEIAAALALRVVDYDALRRAAASAARTTAGASPDSAPSGSEGAEQPKAARATRRRRDAASSEPDKTKPDNKPTRRRRRKSKPKPSDEQAA